MGKPRENMAILSVATALKLAKYGVIVAVALQVIFCIIFQIIGYDSYLLSITLVASIIIGYSFLIVWKTLKAIR